VQFSKAGLDVPEELSLFKKSGGTKVPENSDAGEQVSPLKFVEPAPIVDSGRECNNKMKDLVKAIECQPIMGFGAGIPEPETEEPSDDAHMLTNQKIQLSIPSCSGAELDLQVINLIRTIYLSHFLHAHQCLDYSKEC
jgi:ATP-dependent RNA helicase DHX37/DHR1